MSKYTTEVRFICESYAGYDVSKDYNNVGDVLNGSWDKVFDFDFPIFDENYRSVLCKKILKHYYTREIGLETVGLWKLKLDTLMNEIMPYYNERYKTTVYDFNPLYDVNYSRSFLEKQGGENESNRIGNRDESGSGSNKRTGSVGVVDSSTSAGTGKERFSDTPQGGLVGLENDNYLTNATLTNSNTQNNGQSTTAYDVTDSNEDERHTTDGESNIGKFNTTKDYVENIVGKMGGKSYTSLVTEFRDSLINIDMEIIDSLKDLFMKLW